MARHFEFETLKKCMTISNGKKFSVVGYCKLANLNRQTYYKWYKKGPSNLFTEVLERQIELNFVINKNCRVMKGIENLLKHIEEEWKVYRWMYNNTTTEHHNQMCQKLKKTLFDILNAYSLEFEGIGQKKLKAIVSVIYDSLLSWILHECSEKRIDVYQAMVLQIAPLEGHRCSFYYKKK